MTNGARSDSIVRGFALSSVFWLLIGLVVGLWLAAEMIFPALNLAPWLAFGRLRVVHTNGLIFGFTLAGIFACKGFPMLEKRNRTPPSPFRASRKPSSGCSTSPSPLRPSPCSQG